MTKLEVQLASRNVFRQGIRSMMPLLIVALAANVIILIGGFYQYMFNSLEDGIVKKEGHFWIRPRQSDTSFLNKDELESIKAHPNIRVAAIRSPLSGVVGKGDKSSLFSGRAVDPHSEAIMSAYPSDQDVTSISQESAKIGILLAEGLGLQKEDWVSGIAGYYSFSARASDFVRTDSEDTDRFFMEIPYDALGGIDYATITSLHLQVRDLGQLKQTMDEIKAIFPTVRQNNLSMTTYVSPDSYVSAVKTIYENNLAFIMVVLAVTVFFAIAAAFTLSITERTQELGTMRSFGAQPSHLDSLFQMESFFLSMYGFVFGLSLAFVAGLIINALGGIEIPPPPTVDTAIQVGFVFQPRYAIIAWVIVLFVGQVSSLIVTRRLNRLSVIRQLGLNS